MKQKIITYVLTLLLAPIAVGIILWQIEPIFKPSLKTASTAEEKTAKNTIRPSSYTGTTSTRTQGNEHISTEHIAPYPVAIKGNINQGQLVLDALGLPLKLGIFKSSFVTSGTFDKVFENSDDIKSLALPREFEKITLIKIGGQEKKIIQDALNAIRVNQSINVKLIEAKTGIVIKHVQFIAEGVGFNDEAVLASLKEDLIKQLSPLRTAF